MLWGYYTRNRWGAGIAFTGFSVPKSSQKQRELGSCYRCGTTSLPTGDLVTGLITGIIRVTIWDIGVINLLTRSL